MTAMDVHLASGSADWQCYRLACNSSTTCRMHVGGPASYDYTQRTDVFPTGTWLHLAGRILSTTSRTVFVNGKGTTATGSQASPSVAPDQVNIGRIGSASPSTYWDGMIAYPAIWENALSDNEITALSNGAHPSIISPHTLWAAWNFDNSQYEQRNDFGSARVELRPGGTPQRGISGLSLYGDHPEYDYGPARRSGAAAGNRRRRVLLTGSQ